MGFCMFPLMVIGFDIFWDKKRAYLLKRGKTLEVKLKKNNIILLSDYRASSEGED